MDKEIKALARIDHPGLVRALDVGQLSDGRTYLVEQYVSGVNLRSVILPQGMDLRCVARLVRQIGQALTAAHERGVIHRDLKPENIMLHQVGEEKYVKLIDFGIATVFETTAPAETKATKVVGTVDYMAPEQLEGRPCAASDIYALGVIAFEMVTGRRPFDPGSPDNLLELQRAGVRVKPCDLRSGLPEAAQAVILKALLFAPQDRYLRAQDFCEDLAQALTANPNPSPLWLILSILFLALTVGLAAVIARRFLGNATDVTGISITLSLGLLCLSVGSAFTRNGQQWVEHGFSRFGLKLTLQGKWRMVFTLAGALIVSAFYFSLPTIANAYNERAIEFQQAGDLSAALRSFERAVNLNPGYAVAHYNLASAYEDVEAFDEALAEYQTAMRADPKFYFAHNNLARLYLLRRKDHGSALNILNAALVLRPKETQVKYSLYKNRGWAHLGLGYYDLAVADLRESLNCRQDGAAAHCLLAQALEAQGQEATAGPEWEACLSYAAGETDVEASWLSLARKRLEQGEKK